MTDSRSRTALELTAEERLRYDPAAAIHERRMATRQDLARRRRRALQAARHAARLLRETFGAQRVVLFGSLAARDRFTPWSDIDLAAWGIAPHRFYAAVAAVTGLNAEFKIELVDPDFCRPDILRAIEQGGILL